MLRVSNTFYSCAIALLSPFRPFALTTVRVSSIVIDYPIRNHPHPACSTGQHAGHGLVLLHHSDPQISCLSVHSMHGISPTVLVHRLSATNERQFGARSGEFWRLMNEFRLQPKRSRRTS